MSIHGVARPASAIGVWFVHDSGPATRISESVHCRASLRPIPTSRENASSCAIVHLLEPLRALDATSFSHGTLVSDSGYQ